MIRPKPGWANWEISLFSGQISMRPYVPGSLDGPGHDKRPARLPVACDRTTRVRRPLVTSRRRRPVRGGARLLARAALVGLTIQHAVIVGSAVAGPATLARGSS